MAKQQSSLLPVPEGASISTEVLRLLALTDNEFEAAFRDAYPEVPKSLDLENDSVEIFNMLLGAEDGEATE